MLWCGTRTHKTEETRTRIRIGKYRILRLQCNQIVSVHPSGGGGAIGEGERGRDRK